MKINLKFILLCFLLIGISERVLCENSIPSSGNTYTVENKEQLKWIADQVNNYKDDFSGKIIELSGDIDLNNEEWP